MAVVVPRMRRKRGVAPVAVDTPAPAPAPAPHSLLRPLGVVGYDTLEPALLAALATEEPLLLVSDHGAAKTLLLVRLAHALGLTLRHDNASILPFDDLIGFPIPDRAGAIRYAVQRYPCPIAPCPPTASAIHSPAIRSSVDTSNPATDRHRKTGHHAGELRLVSGMR